MMTELTDRKIRGETKVQLGATMKKWLAHFKNDQGLEVFHATVIQDGEHSYFEDERGIRQVFSKVYQHPTLGTLTLGKMIPVADLPPEPFDPEKENLVEELRTKLYRFPTLDYDALLLDEPKLNKAINDKFYGVPVEQIRKWSGLIDATVEKLAAARKAAIPEPTFSQEERRRRFTGQTIGDLFIANEKISSSPANNWNGEFAVECAKCHKLVGFEIRVLDILRMKSGFLPLWKCGNPCGKGR
jgi:hypothetical protein